MPQKDNDQHPLLSTGNLIKSSVLAGIFALLILITTILPAEYGIDPTGIGLSLGLTKLANPTHAEPTQPATTEQTDETQKHMIDIIVPAGMGLEYKLHIVKGEKVKYSWQTTGGELYFDLHGEPEGDTTGYFESYAESTVDTIKGLFITPFEGSHGWYWENKGNTDVIVSLMVEGRFEIIGLK